MGLVSGPVADLPPEESLRSPSACEQSDNAEATQAWCADVGVVTVGSLSRFVYSAAEAVRGDMAHLRLIV